MRKDAVVLAMVFILGLLIGVFVTGGVLGTMLMTRGQHEALRAEAMEARERDARMLSEVKQKEALAQRAQAEEQTEQLKKQIQDQERVFQVRTLTQEQQISQLRQKIQELEEKLKRD